jgi:hypothetical protein
MLKTLTFLIEHCQLLAIIAACDLKWSCAARQMFNVLSFADFSIASGIGSSCALGLNYYLKMLLMSVSPLLLWLIGMTVVFIMRAAKKRLNPAADHTYSSTEEVFQMLQVICILMHSSLTRAAFGYFSFEEIHSEANVTTATKHLKADYRATRSDIEYSQFMVVAVLMLIFVVMVPLSLSVGLEIAARTRPEYLEKGGIGYTIFGSLFAKFKGFDRSRLAPHWESVRMLRKMLLNLIVVFVEGSGQQSQACLAVLFLANALLCLVLPFKVSSSFRSVLCQTLTPDPACHTRSCRKQWSI